MSIFAVRLGFALAVAAVCLGELPAHAQTAPVKFWNPGWLGFGGTLNAGQDATTDGSSSGFAGSGGGFFVTRSNFSNGWFAGNERGGMGLPMSGFSPAGSFGSVASEGAQFGYNFKNAPLTVYGGFDTLKYNPGLGGAFSPFDSMPGTAGYAAHAGIEYKPTSNLSLSLGVGYVQQSGRVDSDSGSPSLSNASQFDLVRSRR
jgi:hypothetical protein